MPETSVLDWQDGQPVSRVFGDIYFSRASGIEETRYVFLANNRLRERFAALPADGAFVIGETGFGTGLNFLCAWQLFEELAPAGARLHFVSTELYPLALEEAQVALALWPELEPFTRALLAQYGPLPPGWHRLVFDGGRVNLTLLIGDARETLAQLDGQVDAWFLDGFSPAKNPHMWHPAVFRAIADYSRPGATLATYTCAGAVRRGLDQVGFRLEKVKGFGPKREMLRGEYAGTAGLRAPARGDGRDAVVIGGGLAGTAAARSLARRGWQVTLIERGEALATAASGNPQGVLYARLSPRQTALSQVVLAGYQFTLRTLRELLSCDGDAWSEAPILQLAYDEQEAKRHSRLLELALPPALVRGLPSREASAVAGVELPWGGLMFPDGGWVHPPALCRAQAAHPNIVVRANRGVVRLEYDATSARWRVHDGHGALADAGTVIVAAAAHSVAFEQLSHLPLQVNRGQITLLPATPESLHLKAVLCGESYVAPARGGLHTAGATFAREAETEVKAADNAENLAMLAKLAPSVHRALDAGRLDASKLSGRAGQRCVSPDYLPLVGPADQAQSGLFLTTAHGSRGLITAPLAGEVLGAYLDAEPAPLPRALMRALEPGRFALRRFSASPP
jgi:tRNA 5-methylaminomethyl-2-thiouridine biosynthesis bifunctional protein